MNLEELLAKRELCINDNSPSCVATCPIHIDVKGFMKEVQNGNFEKAIVEYGYHKKKKGFPIFPNIFCIYW